MSEGLLALDVGTQSVRAIIFDAAGVLRAKEQVPIQAYVSPHPGWAEQDVAVFWAALGQACQGVLQQSGAPRPAALALTCQRATSVCIGADDAPLRPAISWLDQRRAHVLPPLNAAWRTLFALLGLGGTIRRFQAQASVNWIAEQQPDLWRATQRYVLLSGYLIHQLTGEWRDSVGSQVGYIPFDFKAQNWAAEHDWKWQALPIRRAQLPELVPVSAPIGALRPEAARHLGLAEGLPVISAAADKACEVLGAGCLAPDQACLSFGTTATVNTTTPGYKEVQRFVPPYPAAVPGAYNNEVQIFRGFWMVSWFIEQFGQPERALAAQRGVPVEACLEALLAQTEAGAMGLTVQPFWSPGIRDPGPEAKGSVIGFGDVHTRAHLYRAIIEGLALSLRAGADKIERRCGAIRQLRVAGGGSQSDGAMEITADIFGMPAERPHVYEASALGAAINAAVGLGLHADHPTAVRAMTRPGERFLPDAERQARYQRVYREVYRPLYRRLRPLYQSLREITGYPAD